MTRKTPSTKKDPDKKVFDVSRPGKTPVSSTSRPVIVGHKPEVQDPMMSHDDDDKRPLLNGKKKLVVQPIATTPTPQGSEAVQSPTLPLPPPKAERLEAQSQPEQDLDLAALQKSTVEAKTATPSAPTLPAAAMPAPTATLQEHIAAMPVPDAAPAPQAPAAEAAPQEPAATPQEHSEAPSGIASLAMQNTTEVDEQLPSKPPVQNDVPDAPKSTPPTQPAPANIFQNMDMDDIDSGQPTEQPQIIVSHHSTVSGGAIAFWIIFIIVFGLLTANVLLDAGILVFEGNPHTNFFN